MGRSHRQSPPRAGFAGLPRPWGFRQLRPVQTHPALVAASHLNPNSSGVDLLILRELTAGYMLASRTAATCVMATIRVDTLEYYDYEIRRVIELGLSNWRAAHEEVTSVDKANVLDSSRLCANCRRSGAQNPKSPWKNMLVDTASMS